MGKLHTLRRAIERNPDDWHIPQWKPWAKVTYSYPMGASFSKWHKKWRPFRCYSSYRRFVAKVLVELGYDVRCPR
jgi:hypothetical protein